MALTAGQNVVATDGTHVDTDGVKRYVALLTQAGTAAPVATVLENTLGGTVVWTRSGLGTYVATLAGAFPTTEKVFFNDSQIYPEAQNGDFLFARLEWVSVNTVALASINLVTLSNQEMEAAGVSGAPFVRVEIRVYP